MTHLSNGQPQTTSSIMIDSVIVDMSIHHSKQKFDQLFSIELVCYIHNTHSEPTGLSYMWARIFDSLE